jgi:hypothetical protein
MYVSCKVIMLITLSRNTHNSYATQIAVATHRLRNAKRLVTGWKVRRSNLGRGQEIFFSLHQSGPARGPTPPPQQWVPGLSRGRAVAA